MILKQKEREKAIALRREGLSYREILEQVPVAKSSLSLWLRSVKLAKRQQQRLTAKRLAAVIRGGEKKREKRIALTKKIKDKARGEIGKLSKRELFLIGVALYWAEGSKEKENPSSSKFAFSNSDPWMIRLFLEWLIRIVLVPKEEIYFSIYIHESHKHRLEEVRNYWQTKTHFSKGSFRGIYFKKNKIRTKRKNVGNTYFGLLRVAVIEGSTLNRKIQGWTEGICDNI